MSEAILKETEMILEETEIQKPYTFRKLNATDIFPMSKIIGKIGIDKFTESLGKDSVKKALGSVTGGDDVTEADASAVGISVILEIVNVICGNLAACEADIYDMLARTSNLSVEEIKELDFVVFMEMIIDFIKKDEFKGFIKVVFTLFN